MRAYAFRESLALVDPSPPVYTNAMEGLEISLALEESEGRSRLRTKIRNTSRRDVFVMPHSRTMCVDWARTDDILLPVSHTRGLSHSRVPPSGQIFLFPGDELVRVRPLRPAHRTEYIQISLSKYYIWPEEPPVGRKSVRFGGVWVAMDNEPEVVLEARAVIEALSAAEIESLCGRIEKTRVRGLHYKLVDRPIYGKPVRFISRMGEVEPLSEANE